MASTSTMLSSMLRKMRLLYAADGLRFALQKIKFAQSNRLFKKQHPFFPIPPDYFLYETFELNYKGYEFQGKWSANDISTLVSSQMNMQQPIRILDWGCGPGRVIRHLPDLLGKQHAYFGSDYNEKYVEWCKKNISNISFITNELEPPLKFESNSFDVVYSLSILTHLSEKSHYSWANEIFRILKPGGIFIVSTQGEAFKNKMLENERLRFEKGELVVRSFSKEGHRIFSTFQPETFVRKLFASFDIAIFQNAAEGNSMNGMQDTWVLRKN